MLKLYQPWGSNVLGHSCTDLAGLNLPVKSRVQRHKRFFGCPVEIQQVGDPFRIVALAREFIPGVFKGAGGLQFVSNAEKERARVMRKPRDEVRTEGRQIEGVANDEARHA